MNSLKLFFLAIFVSLGLSTAQAAPTQAADEVIKNATIEFQTLIKENHEAYRADLGNFYKVVDETVVPHFDTRGIARLVLGRNWKKASPDQRERFEAAFKDSLIQTYARAMLDYYDSVEAEWQPLEAQEGAKSVSVDAKLLRPDSAPIALSFQVRAVDDAWKIIDISVENISLITSFRSQINAEIRANGLDSVIKRLESNTYFSGEAS